MTDMTDTRDTQRQREIERDFVRHRRHRQTDRDRQTETDRHDRQTDLTQG